MLEETLWKEIQEICEAFFSKIKSADKKLAKAQWIGDYARVRALLIQLQHDYPDIDVTKTQDETYNAAFRYFQDILFVATVKNEEFRVNREFSDHMVELAEDDIQKLQGLIDKARKLITNARWLNDDHRRRILLGLERLQTEIHKTKSDYDVALARMADAGAALGKFGKDAKPFADLMEQIFGVFRSKKEDPLRLPSPPKQLPPPIGEDDEANCGD